MVTGENAAEIKPPKMVANDLSIPEKESTKKVKLVVVSDGGVNEMKETAMSNNASKKELGKRVKAEILTTKISIEIQKLGEKTSLERRAKLTMVMDEVVPQVNDIGEKKWENREGGQKMSTKKLQLTVN